MLGGVIIVGRTVYSRVRYRTRANQSFLMRCLVRRSVGRSVCGVCVCVCVCFMMRRYLDLRMDRPLRGVRPLASPPEHVPPLAFQRCLGLRSLLGGPLLGGPLHGAVLRGPLPFGGRLLRGALFVGFFVWSPLGF